MTTALPANQPCAKDGVVFAGHPFSSIGKGEEFRSAFAAYSYLDPACRVFDIFRYAAREDPDYLALCDGRETMTLGTGVRVFHINGDEVENVLRTLEARGEDFSAGRNVIVPAWELPKYPGHWAEALSRFDEVWAISHFVQDSLAEAGVTSHHVGQAVEMPRRAYLPRQTFGIRDSAFVFLTFLDLSSYSDRKNPQAVLELYRRLRSQHPFMDMQLVVKAKNGDKNASEWVDSLRNEATAEIVFIDTPLSSYETHSLIAACDCFLSLHRSEGFGRGAAEAMWIGRTAIATGWSGNLDYMTDHPCAIDYRLESVGPDQYPHAEGQVWAEPDLDHATAIAERLLTHVAFAKEAAFKGQVAVRRECSHRAVGLRMLSRVEALLEQQPVKAEAQV